MCEDKAKFIRNIFLLNHNSQSILKGLIEGVLNRAVDIDITSEALATDSQDLDHFGDAGDSLPLFSPKNKISDEDRNRSNELLQHLQSERQRLLAESSALAQSNESLRSQLRRLQEVTLQQKEMESSENVRAQAAEARASQLQAELSELRRDLDLRNVEHERLRAEMTAVLRRFEQAKEALLQREMAARQAADELEIARDKAAQLTKAEQSLEKYQRKLEEMSDLKRQNRELNDRLDAALDQVNQLESANKALAGVNRLVEQHRNKAVQLESEQLQFKSALLTKDSQLAAVNKELEQALAARDQLDRDLKSLRQQLVHHHEETSLSSSTADKEEAQDTVASLKEKLRKLQRKEREMGIGSPPSGTDGEGENSESEVLRLLRRDLQDEQALRAEREQQLLDAQRDLHLVQQAAKEVERAAALSSKELSSKLNETSHTIRLLEQRLTEKEALADKLEQEKGKLENYTKRSLATFKEKYMAVLQTMKEEKRELEAKLQQMAEKAERNQDTWHREERMLSAAIYEVGVRIMDRRIKAQGQADGDSWQGFGSSGTGSGSREGVAKLFPSAAASDSSASAGAANGASATGPPVGRGSSSPLEQKKAASITSNT